MQCLKLGFKRGCYWWFLLLDFLTVQGTSCWGAAQAQSRREVSVPQNNLNMS